MSSHNDNIRDEAYHEGYEDGYDNGQIDISREDIAREEVSNNPTSYCSKHLDNFIKDIEKEFNCYKK